MGYPLENRGVKFLTGIGIGGFKINMNNKNSLLGFGHRDLKNSVRQPRTTPIETPKQLAEGADSSRNPISAQKVSNNVQCGSPFKESTMARLDKGGTVTLEELLVSSLAQTDALAKLLIEKGLITQAEFMQKVFAKKAGCQAWFRNRIS